MHAGEIAARKKRLTFKIDEPLRKRRLNRPLNRLFSPSVTWDSDVPGFCLIVTKRRAFWAVTYQPRGTNPVTGKRWGGGTRQELGDAMLMSVDDARTAALMAKALVRQGRSPHHEAMALRANVEASRSIIPVIGADALDAYAKALAARSTPSENSRRQALHYVRKAVRLMKAEALPLAAVNVSMVRLMLETMPGSQSERRQVFGNLSRFLTWCRRQGLVETNACDALDRDETPRPGKPRANVPSIGELRAIWTAVEGELPSMRDAVRMMLLTALRRDEAAYLTWGEVDFANRRLVIPGSRMKNGETHEVPLSAPAIVILEARMSVNPPPHALVFPSTVGTPIVSWSAVFARIRKAIGEANASKAQRFVFHDIRRSFVSLLSDEFDVDALDRALAHKRSGISATYNHSSRMGARARAFARWADLLLDEAAPGNVAPFARRARV
jgi:integrase